MGQERPTSLVVTSKISMCFFIKTVRNDFRSRIFLFVYVLFVLINDKLARRGKYRGDKRLTFNYAAIDRATVTDFTI